MKEAIQKNKDVKVQFLFRTPNFFLGQPSWLTSFFQPSIEKMIG